MLKKIRDFLGIEKFSPYINNYFAYSNARSSIYLSAVVILLELWMLISVVVNQFSDSKRPFDWFVIHASCYLVLLFAALFMFCASVYGLKNKNIHRRLNRFTYVLYSVVSIGFGIYISFLDYAKGEQFITLMTMTLFVFCFIVWRPLYSILFLSGSFLLFYFLCNSVVPASYATRVNLFIVWIAILMAAINAFQRRFAEAKKDEKLEEANNILLKLSISDEITGIPNMNYFLSQALECLHDKKTDISKMLFLFIDIENFKNFNEKYGFMEGNELLRSVADAVQEVFKGDTVARFSNDNFVVFAKDDKICTKLTHIEKVLLNYGDEIKMKLKTGAYRPENRDILPIVACDHARYACYSIKKHFEKYFCEYSEEMDNDFHRKQYIINNIDKALEKKYIKVYYQPVMNAISGKLACMEALARWDDPEFGFLVPGVFINTLEEYREIHKLDMYVLNQVCMDIVESLKDGKQVVPVSVNFSRMDFEFFDLAREVEKVLALYGIDKKYIHVEITESAITENDDKLQDAMDRFRKSGYSLWLDDFGSGYSGLNVLKEYDFDVMKIDMKFLHNFDGNEKTRVILRNIITLAKDIGMLTLTEGVETKDVCDFLTEIGCEKLQGFFFGKPMPRSEIMEKIRAGVYVPESV